MKISFLILVLSCCCSIVTSAQGLVVNEVSQGNTGAKEYMEFAVVGTKNCTDTALDLRGWIIDDNNGWFGIGSQQGIARGCVRFRNIPQWQRVRFGSIILVYNHADKNNNITQPDDPTDSNGDGIFIIPIDNTSVIERDTLLPDGTIIAYNNCNFTTVLPLNTNNILGLRNAGDAVHTVPNVNSTQSYHSVGWGDLINMAALNISFANSAAGLCYANLNTIDNNPANQSNWVIGSAAIGNTFETPGLPNNIANGSWLLNMRNAPVPAQVVDSNVVIRCQGGSVTVGNRTYTTTGIYRDTLTTGGGCDSIVITNLKIIVPVTDSISLNACRQVVYRGNTYSASTNFNDTLRTAGGCDSVINQVSITVRQATSRVQNFSLCNGQSYFIGTRTYTTSGIYFDTLVNSAGCDSVVTTTLNFVTATSISNSLTGCGSVSFKGVTYTSNATVIDTFKSVQNCDSIIRTTNIQVGSYALRTRQVCILPTQSFFAGGQNRNTSGIYYDTLLNSSGACDTILITDLRVITPTAVNLTFSDCKRVVYRGNVYTSSQIVRDTVRTFLGCDSVYFIATITISAPTPMVRQEGACITTGSSYLVGNNVYTQQGVYLDTLRTVNGCDSVLVTTDLRVLSVIQYPDVNIDSCFSARLGSTVLTRDTMFSDTLTSQYGCDSIITNYNVVIHRPQIDISTTATLPIVLGNSVVLLLNNNKPMEAIKWTPADILNDSINVTSTLATPTANTLITATAADFFGCTVRDSLLLTVVDSTQLPKQPKLLLPTAFTPNDDGNNDFLHPLVLGNVEIKILRIFNRWGELIFEQLGDGKGWDGTYKNVRQPVGTYIYYCEALDVDNNQPLRQVGNVTLLR